MALFTCLAFAPAADAAGRNFTVLSPPDGSLVESPTISLVVRIESTNIDDIRVEVGGRRQSPFKKQMGRIFVCLEGIRLSPGLNPLRITGVKDDKKVEELNYRIYYRSDLASEANTAPAGYTRYYFHTPGHEKECLSCHRLDFSGVEDMPSSPEKSPCYVCHRKMLLSYRQVHGPAAVWSCTVCHDQRAKRHKMDTPQPDEKLCKGCHESAWQGKKYKHGPTAAGECTVCHNPHGSDEPSFLRLKTAELCVACHEEVASQPHLISALSGRGGHPVYKSPDPFNPDRDFTCISCHNPHANDFPYLLGSDSSSMFQFCQTCHKM